MEETSTIPTITLNGENGGDETDTSVAKASMRKPRGRRAREPQSSQSAQSLFLGKERTGVTASKSSHTGRQRHSGPLPDGYKINRPRYVYRPGSGCTSAARSDGRPRGVIPNPEEYEADFASEPDEDHDPCPCDTTDHQPDAEDAACASTSSKEPEEDCETGSRYTYSPSLSDTTDSDPESGRDDAVDNPTASLVQTSEERKK
jgi:hypothetical protein